MYTKQDSIQAETAFSADTMAVEAVKHVPLTPAKVISWLPKNATPAQQDSIVQRYIKPAPITWSNRPDTLSLPGIPIKTIEYDPGTYKIYNETFFADKPFFHPELVGGPPGAAGEPRPYSITRDDSIMIVLLLCFTLTALGFALTRRFATEKARRFFRIGQHDHDENKYTSTDKLFQHFLVLQLYILWGLIYFFSLQHRGITLFIIDNYLVVATFAMTFFGYVIAKTLLYKISGAVFFTRHQSRLWMHDYRLILGLGGILLFPLLLLQAFFPLPAEATITGTYAIFGICKLLICYKQYIIFFRQNKAYLQNIVYLCTLEIVPIFALVGLLSYITNYLKVSI